MNLENGNLGDGGSGLGYDKDSMSDDKAKKILIGIVSIILIFCVLAYFLNSSCYSNPLWETEV